MPISEEDYAPFKSGITMGSNSPTTTSTMSKAEIRKSHKPIMEKRRRAKINNCLNEIKDLILKAMKKDPERHSKLEKADILEMAVKHLKTIQQKQKEHAIRSDPTIALKYKSGYVECAQEVTKYVDQMDGIDSALKHRLATHLNKSATDLDSNLVSSSSQFPTFASSTLLASFAQAQQNFEKSFALAKNDDQNNNSRSIQGIELIPSCLPNGDFAFLVPKSSFTSILSQSKLDIPDRPSAFVTVTPKLHFRDNQEEANSESGAQLKLSHSMLSPISPPQVTKTGFKIVKPKPEKPQIQNIKFPIQKKDFALNHCEPLCVITNANERFRQAQKVEESRHCDENVYSSCSSSSSSFSSVKRKFPSDGERNVGLLSIIPQESKKFCPEVLQQDPSSSSGNSSQVKLEVIDLPAGKDRSRAEDAISGKNDDKSEPMWRPW